MYIEMQECVYVTTLAAIYHTKELSNKTILNTVSTTRTGSTERVIYKWNKVAYLPVGL